MFFSLFFFWGGGGGLPLYFHILLTSDYSPLFSCAVTNQDVNNEGTVVVKNLKPPGWSGRKYNIGLYKSDNLLVVKENFPVGEGARLNLETKLYFGIVKSKICLGQTISGEEISVLTPFDITEYLGGLQVTLSAEANSGKHSFSGLNIEEDTDHAQENTD